MENIPRRGEGALRRLLRAFPGVLIYGPRQSGKTTLVRTAFPRWTHVDLERPRDAALLAADVESFLQSHRRRLAIDEAQRMPALFPALRHALDQGKGFGRVILLGSASPALLRNVSESLAGRIGLLELTPLLGRELHGTRHARDRWFWGGFPRVHALRSRAARAAWLDAWITTVLERDLPALGIGLPSTRLRLLAQMLSHVHGNLLNVSDLARSLGVSSPTVAGDLDALEGIFMIRRLPPFFANVQKRLTKSAKLYLRDTGVLHVLAGLREPAELTTWSRRGASFEGLVIEEIAALAHEQIVRPGLFFWRTDAGAEVDLLVVDGQRIVPFEVKLGGTVEARELRGLRSCMADLGIRKGYVITGAGERMRIGADIEIVPFADVLAGKVDFEFGKRVRARDESSR